MITALTAALNKQLTCNSDWIEVIFNQMPTQQCLNWSHNDAVNGALSKIIVLTRADTIKTQPWQLQTRELLLGCLCHVTPNVLMPASTFTLVTTPTMEQRINSKRALVRWRFLVLINQTLILKCTWHKLNLPKEMQDVEVTSSLSLSLSNRLPPSSSLSDHKPICSKNS